MQKVVTGSTGSLWQLAPGGGEGVIALVAAVVAVFGAAAVIGVLERRQRA